MEASGPNRYRLWILLAVAITARAGTFGNPNIHVDEQFYLYVARRMAEGAVPFVDVWDRKPIGLFLIYLPAGLLPYAWSIWAYQAIALTAVVATGWIVVRIAEHCGWGKGATLAGVAYVLLLNWVGGQGGQAPVFYDLPVALAMLMVLRGGWRREMAAMALLGLALQIKYSVLFEGVFVGLYVLVRHWRNGARLALVPRAIMLAGIALVPTIAAALWYVAIGQGEVFWYANFLSILDRGGDPFDEQMKFLLTLTAWLAVPVTLAVAGLRDGETTARRFVAMWLAAAVAGVLFFGGWYLHYGLPVMLPASAAMAGLFARQPRLGLAFVVIVALAGQGVVWGNRAGRGTPAQFEVLAARLRSGPEGCLYLYSGPPGLQDASGRCALSRYVFPSHLYRAHEEGAIGIDQEAELRRVLAKRPAMVVLRPYSSGERRDIRDIVEAELHRHYRQLAPAPLGHETLQLWERN